MNALLTCTLYSHYHHDSRNKLKHKLTIYRHYKNAYSDEKESKRREREQEENEERQKVKEKEKKKKNHKKGRIKENIKKKE